jgi:malonyl-CoA O-methyltransferase
MRRLARVEGAPWLHQEVARRMADRLKLFRDQPSDWIDWWGALAGGATAVAAVLPRSRRLVVEPSDEWVLRSRQLARGPWWSILGRGPAQQRIGLVADASPAQASMVWANMMLHLCPNPPGCMAQWHAALKVGGILMFSTLGPDSLRELRALYAEQGWPAPHAPFTDMHDIGDQLVHSGFADPVMDQERIVLNWSSPQAMLTEMRTMGANLSPTRPPGLRTPRWLARLHDALAQRADAQGRIHLSFEVVYGHAFKATPKVARDDAVPISLESLRSKLGVERLDP